MKTFAVRKSHQPAKAWSAPGNANRLRSVNADADRAQIRQILQPQSIQPKLKIGEPNDKYEQEADRVAEQVMRMPEPGCPECDEELVQTKPLVEQISPLIQRQEEEEEEELQTKRLDSQISPLIQKQTEEGEEEEEELLQTKEYNSLQRQPIEEEEEEEPVQTKCDRSETGETTPQLTSDIHAMKGSGQPLPNSERAFFEPRFGRKFGDVRLHTGTEAAETAQALRARAYTIGKDITFGAGEYKQETFEGNKLLAHELAHVVQQSQSAYTILQRLRLRNYKDKKPEHDPSKLSDSEIEATKEYKDYMDKSSAWQTELKVKREEALLACRLMLRAMRGGVKVKVKKEARDYVLSAREQLGTLVEAEKLKGKLEWVGSGPSEFASPTTAKSDFTKWILGGGSEPTDTGKMNCWEMVLFAAYKGKFIDKTWIETVYKEAAKKSGMGPPAEIEKNLCKGPRLKFDPKDSDSPEPLPGDIVIFDIAAKHVAISFKKEAGKHKVISLWTTSGPSNTVVEDSIENILTRMHMAKADFCGAPW
jgi:hypothetical protein